MTLNKSDPRLTAYVLGELDEEQRQEIEQLLKQDPEARREVEELRQAGQWLRESLAVDSGAALDQERLDEVLEEADGRPRRTAGLNAWQKPLAAAACLVLALALSVAGIQYWSQEPNLDTFGLEAEANKAELQGRSESPRRKLAQKALSEQSTSQDAQPATVPVSSGETDVLTKSGTREFRTTVEAGRPINGRDVAQFERLRSAASSLADRAHPLPAEEALDREGYNYIQENAFRKVADHPLSTFSIDVDTASYANVRRFINGGQRPPADAVRIEELINYFNYDLPNPSGSDPFSITTELATCAWKPEHLLLQVSLKGRELAPAQRPASNLVFLVDVSGSMNYPAKLPLLKRALRMLVERLDSRDRVAMVVYAGSAGVVLPSTAASEKGRILQALEQLRAGGSTHGSAGIVKAYEIARQNFIPEGVNRVILATDGDFNVGVSSEGELLRLIEEKREGGVELSVLGFGTGNLQDSKMEQLANHGNGNYSYIDSHKEARKVLVEEMGGTLVTIAKDVKIQIEFNPLEVGAYRLIGYENRLLAAEDFNDDAKDAGEIGAGHTVTALYEIIPAGLEDPRPAVDPLRYQRETDPTRAAASGELATVKLRYKPPAQDSSLLIEGAVLADPLSYEAASDDLRFASAIAAYGMLLRNSPHKGNADLDLVLELANGALGYDPGGLRADFLTLAEQSRSLID